MEEIEVPSYFLCPISLEIMRDPVTVSTGITYDRASIERWIFSGKNATCPVTKQVLSVADDIMLTPNVTLRRYIQAWCTLNASQGIERFPTPKAPVTRPQVMKLLRDAQSPHMQMQCLRRLRSLASESEANRISLEKAGVVEFLATIIRNDNDTMSFSSWGPQDEALSVLHSLKLSDSKLKSLLKCRDSSTQPQAIGYDDEFIDTLVRAMQRLGHYESRALAVTLLKSMLELAEPLQIMGLKQGLYVEVVQILKDQISQKASKASLQLLINVGPFGRNRIKAVEAGAVGVLVDLLLDTTEKRTCEMILTALDLLSQCADGRAELVRHPAGLAVVSKKILRVSHAASERAVKILYSVSRFSATPGVVHEMLQLGVAAKLCLVAQVECGCGGGGSKTKERAVYIIKLHAKSWINSPCLPANFKSFYLPSSNAL
ncbi:unnamed protein product [Cuscuta campestris]|uniref:U-box domain-containing protein n=1 Tax=Cuscuta campestris TaxID=132261 RepID=A0A484LCI9_9ASTE|nr:unnamed protein product [Cuscuta campestris]